MWWNYNLLFSRIGCCDTFFICFMVTVNYRIKAIRKHINVTNQTPTNCSAGNSFGIKQTTYLSTKRLSSGVFSVIVSKYDVSRIPRRRFSRTNRYPHKICSDQYLVNTYRQVSNIKRTLVGNLIVGHSDVVGASPVGAAPTTSSFST